MGTPWGDAVVTYGDIWGCMETMMGTIKILRCTMGNVKTLRCTMGNVKTLRCTMGNAQGFKDDSRCIK
jgi:hypothetical protein